MGARTSTTCVANAYCTQLIDATTGGETIMVFYTYKNSTSQPPTVTDDKGGGSSTYTCVTEGHDGATNLSYSGGCYTVNAASGIRNITVTWPVATATQGAVAVGLAYNVNAFDTSSSNGTQTATTTWSAGSLTTTAANDLVCQWAVGTTTRTNVSAFSVGSGYTMQIADRRDAGAVQCQVIASAGSTTPSLTGQSNGYVSTALAFKAGSSGTLPSGMYVKRLYHYNSASGIAGGTINLQAQADSGDLLVLSTQGGGSGPQTVTAVSDGSNGSWSGCGGQSTGSGGPTSSAYFFPNSAAGLLALSVTTSGTGDQGPLFVYDIAGAATTQTCVHQAAFDNSGTVGHPPVTPYTDFHPGANSGITISSLGVNFNTVIGVTAPSAAKFDANTAGGQSLDGPSVPDENNGMAHAAFSDNTAQTWTWSGSNSGENIQTYAGQSDSFQASGATLRPAFWRSGSNTVNSSGTTIAAPAVSVQAGSLLWAIAYWNSSSQTETCSDSVNGSWTAVDSATTGTGGLASFRSQTFYFSNSAAGSSLVVTCTSSGSNAARGIAMHVVTGVSTLDQHPAGKTGSASTVTSNTTSTTAAANEYIVSGCVVANTLTTATSPWKLRENANFGTNGTEDQIVTATGTFQGSFSGGGTQNFICFVNTFQ